MPDRAPLARPISFSVLWFPRSDALCVLSDSAGRRVSGGLMFGRGLATPSHLEARLNGETENSS